MAKKELFKEKLGLFTDILIFVSFVILAFATIVGLMFQPKININSYFLSFLIIDIIISALMYLAIRRNYSMEELKEREKW